MPPVGVTQIKMQNSHRPCRRLVASGCLPDRADQPAKIMLHLSLEQLTRRLAGTPAEGSGTGGPDIAASNTDSLLRMSVGEPAAVGDQRIP
jgi:hypothetical protein